MITICFTLCYFRSLVLQQPFEGDGNHPRITYIFGLDLRNFSSSVTRTILFMPLFLSLHARSRLGRSVPAQPCSAGPWIRDDRRIDLDLRALVLVFISLAMLYMAMRSYISCLRIESDQCEGRWMRCFVGDLVNRCWWWSWWWSWLLPSWGRVSRLYE
jgi:hypothetical protein